MDLERSLGNVNETGRKSTSYSDKRDNKCDY